MYRHCIFCRGDLGTNEELPFAVGKRLAFDEAKGRLWVICPACARWNLSPLEERWEAIESAERLYRATRRRVATDNIGLAQIGDRVDLIRIGAPLRPEFAAWRYGAEFLRRRTRAMVFNAVDTVLTLGALSLGGGVVMFGAFGGRGGIGSVVRRYMERRAGGQLFILPDATTARVFTHTAATSKLVRSPSGEVGLELRYDERLANTGFRRVLSGPFRYRVNQKTMLHEEDMLPALRLLLPLANGEGARKKFVDEAVGLLDQHGDVRHVLGHAIPQKAGRSSQQARSLAKITPSARLALEMAMHEGDERAAMEGELQALHDRWREAEEIAAIADDLLIPDSVRKRLGELGGAEAP